MSEANIVNLRSIINIENWLEDPAHVYIGRATKDLEGSKWGNPYIVTTSSPSNRELAIASYRNHIKGNTDLIGQLGELKNKILGCWCAPLPCHGEYLHELTGNVPIYEQSNTLQDLSCKVTSKMSSFRSPIVSPPAARKTNSAPTSPSMRFVNGDTSNWNNSIGLSTPIMAPGVILQTPRIQSTPISSSPSISMPSSSSTQQTSPSNSFQHPNVSINRTLSSPQHPLPSINVVSSMTPQPANNTPTQTNMLQFLNNDLSLADITLSQPHQENEVTTLRRQVATLEERLNAMIGAHNHLNTQLKTLEAYSYDHSRRVFELEKELSNLQQYDRRENIEIIGIPNTVTDDLLESKVIEILRSIGLHSLSSYEIVACHRLRKTNTTKPANTIVRFTNRKIAHYALQNRKSLRWCYPSIPNLFIIENLCPRYRSIFDECLELKKKGTIKHVWSYNGVVHYKTVDNRNVRGTRVSHMSELVQSFNIEPGQYRRTDTPTVDG